MRYYAVYDTNVLISSILTKHADSATALVVDAITRGKIIPVYNQEILDEYDKVLHRPKFNFSEIIIQKILRIIRQFGVNINLNSMGIELPDEADVVFYEVVLDKAEAFLITGNIRHFPKRYFIVTPAEMMKILQEDELCE